MSTQYTRSAFLRQVPNQLLEEYFRRLGLLNDVNFEELKKYEFQPVLNAIDKFPEQKRDQIDRDFQDVHALANPAGTAIFRNEAKQRELEVADQLDAMDNHYHRAMWLFLNRDQEGEDLFGVCTTMAHLLNISFTKSKRCTELPKKAPLCDEGSLKRLSNEVSDHYRRQGRGYRCIVEHYSLNNPDRDCFVAYPEDFTSSQLHYNGNKLICQSTKLALEVVFMFTKKEGTLEVSAPGGPKEARIFQDIFCRANLGLLGLPEKSRLHQYNLDLLKDRNFAFPTRPEDGIEKVEVIAMRLSYIQNEKQRITVEQDPFTGESVHVLLDETLNKRKISLGQLRITYVKMRFTFFSENGNRPTTLTFTLTSPDYTSLGDLPKHRIAKGYLVEWKIAP